MKIFFLNVWAKNVGAHYTWELITHSQIWYISDIPRLLLPLSILKAGYMSQQVSFARI